MSREATRLSIQKRNRDPKALAVVRADDFECEPSGTLSVDDVVGNPRLSPYALDPERERVLFVETPPDGSFLTRPFLYQAQANLATRLVALPYPLFFEWGERCPPADGVVMFYSVGRCGSTLLSKLLHASSSIVSLSEPDVYSQIDAALWARELAPDLARRLIRATVRFSWTPDLKPGARCLVIKTRYEIPSIVDAVRQEFPSSHAFFMYRNAEAVISSFYFLRRQFPHAVDRLLGRLRAIAGVQGRSDVVEAVFRAHGHLGLEVLQWAWSVDQYLELRDAGRDIVAVRYEDLTANPDRVMRQLLERWGLTWDPSVTNAVMSEDSQQGTALEKSSDRLALTDQERDVVRSLIREVSRVQSPDEIIPGSLR